jgi:uncharacterized membrane protein YfcA
VVGVLFVALPVGLFIGTVGIGGVLLPPALTQLGGLDVHSAAGTSSWCFLFTGGVGALVYARQQVMPWQLAGWLALGAAPAAAAGALVNSMIPASALTLILSCVTAGSGIYHLCARAHAAEVRIRLPAAQAIPIGAAVGFGSALTGTGGPVLLVPGLLAFGVAPLTTVAASQLIQLPLVGFAALGYSTTNSVRFGLGTLLGVIASLGVLLGALTARRLQPPHLHRIAAVTLVIVGAFLLPLTFLPLFQH